MLNHSISNLFNIIKTKKQNNIHVFNVHYSKKNLDFITVLFKEGYIRGYFIKNKDKIKNIVVLLKLDNDFFFDLNKDKYKKNKNFIKHRDLMKQYTGFSLNIVSSTKGIMTNVDALKFGLGGIILININ